MGAQISNPLDITPTALRVLKVFPNSPCFKAGIEPFFDYILSLHIDNILTPFSDVFSYNESLILSHFFDIITKNVNKPVGLTIFSVYTQEKRYLEVIPSRDWPNSDSLLGILIRNEEIANALERTFKVLSVLPGSPAFLSGLIAEEDYILGLTFHKYKGIRDFKDILTQNTGKTHEICVFNQKSRDIKYITLQPNKDWGGEGIIGCEFGFGGMNQLKIGLENVKNSNEFFEKKEEKLGIEDKLIEKVEKTSVLTKNSILQSNKLRIPPKNPFNYPLYHKKPSFEKNLADKEENQKDFLEVEFLGIPKYENPTKNDKIEKNLSRIDSSKRINQILNLNSIIVENEKLDKTVEKDENKSKIITKYTFFAKKINRDYIIRSDELVKLDILIT